MTAQEIKAKIDALLKKIEADIPTRDGKPIFTCHKRSFYSDDALKSSEEVIPRVTTTVWGEIYFDALGDARDDEEDEDDKGALTFMVAVDVKGGEVYEKRITADDALEKFERDIYDGLFKPARDAEDIGALISIMKEKSEQDREAYELEYRALAKKFYKKLLIGSSIALAILLPLIIWGIKYVF